MGLLIFCTTRDEVERVAASLGDQRVATMVGWEGSFESVVLPFVRGEASVLVTAGSSLVTGWRAPPGTVVLFSATFPEGPERVQAAARVLPTGATGGW